MKKVTVAIGAVNVPAADGVTVYPAPDAERVLLTEENRFADVKLLVFGNDGRLREAGGNLYPNTDGRLGSPQLSLKIPAGGFAVAFGKDAPAALAECHAFAMEGAMLYNATMTVDREVYGRLDGKTLTLSYQEADTLNPFALKFLFIGNSCTYFNGVPLKFRALCRAAGLTVDVAYCTFGAAYLREFADRAHRYHKALTDALHAKKYDFAVLQDAGAASGEETLQAIRGLLPYLQENGARPFLYMRCAPHADMPLFAEQTAELSCAYRSVGKALGIPVSPVAEAFALCRERFPQIGLYADDRSHHSAAGSYLAACCLAERFLLLDVRGLAYDAYLGTETADCLQEIAHEVCRAVNP